MNPQIALFHFLFFPHRLPHGRRVLKTPSLDTKNQTYWLSDHAFLYTLFIAKDLLEENTSRRQELVGRRDDVMRAQFDIYSCNSNVSCKNHYASGLFHPLCQAMEALPAEKGTRSSGRRTCCACYVPRHLALSISTVYFSFTSSLPQHLYIDEMKKPPKFVHRPSCSTSTSTSSTTSTTTSCSERRARRIRRQRRRYLHPPYAIGLHPYITALC